MQHDGQLVVTPLHVTCPGSRVVEQLGFTARQSVLALEQLLVLPSRHVTVALQVFSFRTTEARFIEATCVAQEDPARDSPRIAARVSSETGPGLGESAKPATETKRRVQATIHVLFINLSSFAKLRTPTLEGASRGRR
ncbi:MAG TPA: hypothetical protein VLT87_29460 [Thermoanaerobaculia bacterium]|nr:hypothetical protein [Thermoanaerobaculia bacterium]